MNFSDLHTCTFSCNEPFPCNDQFQFMKSRDLDVGGHMTRGDVD